MSLPALDRPSRRELMITAAVALTISPAAALGEGEAAPSPTRTDDVRERWQQIVDHGDLRVPARREPYRLSGPIRIPAGRRVVFAPGTRIIYDAPRSDAPTGAFVIAGNDVSIGATSGEVVVETPADDAKLWAVLGAGVERLVVTGVRGLGCGHVRLTAAVGPYAAISTAPGSRDVNRDVTIRGGGARFRIAPADGEGACYMTYTLGWTLRDATYERVPHGVQWWGGNAWPGVADGAAVNERKCRDFVIARVSVTDASQAGLWGSMGQNGRVEDCTVTRCGDVGLDAEGCVGVTFRRCTSIDAVNGCCTAFFLNRDVVFEDCTVRSTNPAWPLFRSYNVTQSSAGTGLVAIRGGHWACTSRTAAGVIDTAAGPTATLEITGATLVNVRIDTAHFSMHDTRIVGNRLCFPSGLADGAAIRAGSAKLLGTAGTTVVEDNSIELAPGYRGDRAIQVVEDDYNSAATAIVRRNRVTGTFRLALVVQNASTNRGIRPRFVVEDNRIAGPASLAPTTMGEVDLVAARNRRPASRR